jgi:hypothetical protein
MLATPPYFRFKTLTVKSVTIKEAKSPLGFYSVSQLRIADSTSSGV